jgi:Secretion system C-terminal sorting domain/Carbohydrate esterase, sialic acid-specific acetylesterase
MKKSSLLIVFLLFSQISFGQRYFSVMFDSLPEDYQLLPRNEKSEATVAINGRIELADWKYLSVVVLRNKKVYQYKRSDILYNSKGDVGTFDLKPVIKSELAEYDFQIYASQTGKDSILMTSRSNVVAGDVYMIYGQSNARAWEVDYKYRNEYARTYGFGSQQYGFTWGLSNSGYTGGYNGEANIVGEWGIEFQRAIAENYGIPTCVINCATSGATIKVLSDRNPNNPADYNTLYGRLLDYAQKAKVINNIKGFFYWQAETDAAQNPKLWKPGFDILYKYFEQDFPSVKKYYTFQIPLFGAGEYNDEVGVLRDYLRKLGDYYPKITTYAPVGAAGWNGWHFELEGYIQIGKELGRLVGYDFYNEKKKVSPPNIKKAYYSTKDRSEISLAFEDEQQMLYPKDTISTKIGGGEMNMSLKDFFYLNGEWQKVASGRAEGNRIILKLKKNASATDTLIKYLPSIYPYSNGSFILQEAPWIYVGPFLKNSEGMRAFIFHNFIISPFQEFQPIILKNIINENKNVTLQWNNVAGAKSFVLERGLASDTLKVELVLKLSSSTLSFSDTTAKPITEYWYRIKAVTDLYESTFSTIKIKTVEDINSFQIKAETIYFNKATISWVAPKIAVWDYFILEKRQGDNDSFKQIAKLQSSILSFTDTTLQANLTYIYRIKAYNATSQSIFAQVAQVMPSLLAKSDLKITTIYYNSLKINWSEIPKAKTYILEKSVNNGLFKIVKEFDLKTLEYLDNSLSENTNYSYRIKALGDKTESPTSQSESKTPALLAQPELTSTPLFYNSLKITWKAILGVIQYKLERKTGTEDYKSIGIFDNKIAEFLDKDLKENTVYLYRLKAFGDKTESLESVLTTTTPAILSLPELTFENLTHESVKLKWKAIPTANKYFLERQAQGELNFQKIFETDNLLEYLDSKLKDISPYSYRLKVQSNVSESGYSKIDLKTLAILANQNEENNPFIIYPNPAKDKITVSFTEAISGNVSLIDILGKTQLEQKISKQKSVELNVNSLKKGFYLVLIKTNEALYSQKIIVE